MDKADNLLIRLAALENADVEFDQEIEDIWTAIGHIQQSIKRLEKSLNDKTAELFQKLQIDPQILQSQQKGV